MKSKRLVNLDLLDYLNELADRFGDHLLFNAFLELWDLDVIKAAIDQRIEERDTKKRQNSIRFDKRDIVLKVDHNECVICHGDSGSDFLEVMHLGENDKLHSFVTVCRTCRNNHSKMMDNPINLADIKKFRMLRNKDFAELEKEFNKLP